MYHVTFILHDQAIHPSSFHSIILIISGGRSNLWSYTLCSFLQFPITFSHKSPTTDQYQHCSQTQSTVYPQCHRPTVTPTSIKILHKQTHTCLYFNSHIFRKQDGEQNIMKLWWALLQINFLSISSFCNLYSLTPLQNTSSSPPFKNFKQCISDVIFLRCKIPGVPLEHIVRVDMWPINTQLHCSNYKWQLHFAAKK